MAIDNELLLLMVIATIRLKHARQNKAVCLLRLSASAIIVYDQFQPMAMAQC